MAAVNVNSGTKNEGKQTETRQQTWFLKYVLHQWAVSPQEKHRLGKESIENLDTIYREIPSMEKLLCKDAYCRYYCHSDYYPQRDSWIPNY